MEKATAPATEKLVADAAMPAFASASLWIFLAIGGLEVLFFGAAVFVVASIPPGSTETFPFSRNIGLFVLGGQIMHVIGSASGIISVFREKARTLGSIGAASNIIVPLLFFFS